MASVRSASSIGSYNGSIVVPHDGGEGTVRSICSTSSQGSTFTSAQLPYDCYSSVSSAGSHYTAGQQPYDNGRQQITQESSHTYVDMVESERVYGSSALVPSTPAPGPSTPAPEPSGMGGRGFPSKLGHSRSNLPRLLDTFNPQVHITMNKKLIDKGRSEETGCDEVLNENAKSVEAAEDMEQGLTYELTDIQPTNIPKTKTNLCQYITRKVIFFSLVISTGGLMICLLAFLPLLIWWMSSNLAFLYILEADIVLFLLFCYKKPIGMFLYHMWQAWY